MMERKESLAIIGGRVFKNGNQLVANFAFGKVVEAFAKRYRKIYLSSPLRAEATLKDDYRLPDNVTLFPQPDWGTTIESFKYLSQIKNSYKGVITSADHIFVRGNPVAATSALYRYCTQQGKPVCHWLVGNPMVLLQSHKRGSAFRDTLGKLYIWKWERALLSGRKVADGSFLCNGQEIANRYPTSKTLSIVSTTLTQDDFFERNDTCNGNVVTLLCLCYVRPEKGIEYLIEALSSIKVSKQVDLMIAGDRDRYPAYQLKLDGLIKKFKLEKRVKWLGHVQHKDIPDLMCRSDIFVLPTLSEGTPRVLVEARANSLPLVTTNVGGIPTSVTNGYDGLLVSPKDPRALASSISKVIEDRVLRKQLIENGYTVVQKMTIDNFVNVAIKCFVDSSFPH